jgi:hypothetical protein
MAFEVSYCGRYMWSIYVVDIFNLKSFLHSKFKVKLNLVLYTNPSNSLALVANLKNNGVDQPGNYNVMQLIIDFTSKSGEYLGESL